ncbi:hypothetical protein L1987_23928 [Smallanthus sonchifolius]|uniref:Uncharacterized protein n=1 Tax=Smallanthus sonchifolius TaxID=185202 RepID=A0ACB9IJX3_9ASTR|nr:hypothetical protein L1987_23928 [Smallanthus sonchifolius]
MSILVGQCNIVLHHQPPPYSATSVAMTVVKHNLCGGRRVPPLYPAPRDHPFFSSPFSVVGFKPYRSPFSFCRPSLLHATTTHGCPQPSLSASGGHRFLISDSRATIDD